MDDSGQVYFDLDGTAPRRDVERYAQERKELHEALLDRAPRDERERLHEKLHEMAETEIDAERRA